MSTSPPLWLIADRPTGWLLVLARAASCAVCLRTTFCRSSWERKGHLLRDTHASSCCWGMLTRPPWETLGFSPQVRSPCEVCGFDGVCILFAAEKQPVKRPFSASLDEDKNQHPGSLVHSKCYMPGLFFRKLYLFFFYKSTTGTKVKE